MKTKLKFYQQSSYWLEKLQVMQMNGIPNSVIAEEIAKAFKEINLNG